MYRVLDKAAGKLAQFMAYFGGAILIGLSVMTCLSVFSREVQDTFGIGPGALRGVYDITQIAIAAAAFGFLAWCQYNRGHAAVDLFQDFLGGFLNRLINFLADLGFFLAAVVATYWHYIGMTEKTEWEVTFILQYPIKNAYLFSLFGLIAFVLVSAFCVLRSARAMALGLDQEDGELV